MADPFIRQSLGVHLEDNTFMFNGVDFSNEVVVESITRTLTPPVNVRSADLPGVHGQYVFDRTYGNRIITVNIRIVEETYQEAVEKAIYVSSELSKIMEGKLILRDLKPQGFHNKAMLTSEGELSRLVDTLSAELTFTCYKPFNYKTIEKNILISDPIAGGTIVNEGLPVVPQLKVLTGSAVVTGDIEIDTNDGQTIVIKGPFPATTNISFQDNTLYVGSTKSNHKIDFVQSNFITLKTGSTIFTVTGAGTGATFRVIFEEAWL